MKVAHSTTWCVTSIKLRMARKEAVFDHQAASHLGVGGPVLRALCCWLDTTIRLKSSCHSRNRQNRPGSIIELVQHLGQHASLYNIRYPTLLGLACRYATEEAELAGLKPHLSGLRGIQIRAAWWQAVN